MPDVAIRRARQSDADAVIAIFRDAILIGTKAHYTAAQRDAWAGPKRDPKIWHSRVKAEICFVAEISGQIVGFMTLSHDGLLDLAFVSPSVQGTGVAHALYEAIENSARDLGLSQIRAEASHLARPFFARQGWQMITEQQVEIRGEVLTNFRMEKNLTQPFKPATTATTSSRQPANQEPRK